jgi:hypothetical protein
MALFDGVIDEYDAARPGYPEAILDGLGPLDGALVLEGGPGTESPLGLSFGVAPRSSESKLGPAC